MRTRPGDDDHVPDEGVTWEGFVAALRVAPQYMLLAFVMFAGIGCISLLVKNFALDEFGITETAFGQLVLGPALVIGLIAVPAGRLADRWGKARCVQLGFSLAAVGLWGIPILHHIFRDDLVTGKTAFILAAAVMGDRVRHRVPRLAGPADVPVRRPAARHGVRRGQHGAGRRRAGRRAGGDGAVRRAPHRSRSSRRPCW